MPSKQLLNTHPLPSLKREIRKTNITGYSKLTKDEIIELMLKHKDRFHHMTDYVKPERKPRKPRVKKEKVVEEKKENKEDILDKKLDKLHENLNNTEFPSLEILNETARTLMDYRDLGGNKHKGLVKLIYKRQKATIAKSKEKKPDNKRKLISKTINYDKPSKDVVIKSVSKAKKENKKIVIKKEEQSKGTAKKVSKIQQPKQVAKVIKPKEKRQPLTNAKVIKAEPKEENIKKQIKILINKYSAEEIKKQKFTKENLKQFTNPYFDLLDKLKEDLSNVENPQKFLDDNLEINKKYIDVSSNFARRIKAQFKKNKEELKEEPKKKEPKKEEEKERYEKLYNLLKNVSLKELKGQSIYVSNPISKSVYERLIKEKTPKPTKEKRQPLTNAKVIKAEPKEENFKQPIKGNMTKEQVLKDLKEYGEKIGREISRTSTIGRGREGLEKFLNTYNIDYIHYRGGDKAGVRADTIEIIAIKQPTMEYHQRFKVLFVKKKEEPKKKEPKKKEPKKKEELKRPKEIPKNLEEVWDEYMSEKAGSFAKKISVQQDELEELIELDKKYKQYERERKDTENSAKIQLNAIGEQNEMIEDIRTNVTDENPNLLKVYKKFAPTIFNVITKQLKSEE